MTTERTTISLVYNEAMILELVARDVRSRGLVVGDPKPTFRPAPRLGDAIQWEILVPGVIATAAIPETTTRPFRDGDIPGTDLYEAPEPPQEGRSRKVAAAFHDHLVLGKSWPDAIRAAGLSPDPHKLDLSEAPGPPHGGEARVVDDRRPRRRSAGTALAAALGHGEPEDTSASDGPPAPSRVPFGRY